MMSGHQEALSGLLSFKIASLAERLAAIWLDTVIMSLFSFILEEHSTF